MTGRAIRSDILKEEFGRRLNKLCDDSGFIPKGRGRTVALTKHFDLNQESVRRWLNGTNYPDIENAETLADLFKANVGWLLSGEGVPYRQQLTDADEFHHTGKTARFLPILDHDAATSFSGSYANLNIKGWEATDLKAGDYWIRVSGSSMDDGSDYGIKAGALILIDTSQSPENEEYALILLQSQPDPIFKKYIKDGPNQIATSLNKQYPPIDLSSNEHRILGKVIDAIYRPLRR